MSLEDAVGHGWRYGSHGRLYMGKGVVVLNMR